MCGFRGRGGGGGGVHLQSLDLSALPRCGLELGLNAAQQAQHGAPREKGMGDIEGTHRDYREKEEEKGAVRRGTKAAGGRRPRR